MKWCKEELGHGLKNWKPFFLLLSGMQRITNTVFSSFHMRYVVEDSSSAKKVIENHMARI